jgi:hypothetical protein
MVHSGAPDWNPEPDLEASQTPQIKGRNTNKTFRAYNQTRDAFLDVEVVPLDTTVEPLKKLFDYLAARSITGLWLNPYRGIPATQVAQQFDLVYLDQDCQVIQEVETYPSPEMRPQQAEPASALFLPGHTAFAAQLQPGDQLLIYVPNETERQSEPHSGSNGANSAKQSPESSAQEHRRASQPRSGESSQELQFAIDHLTEKKADWPPTKKETFKSKYFGWLFPDRSDRRRSNRHPLPGLVAYHWTGGAPRAYRLGDISETGFYLLTEERPLPGTIILMTLQRTDSDSESAGDSIAVHTKVVRWGVDGVGLLFVLPGTTSHGGGETLSDNGADLKTLKSFLGRLKLPG